MNETLELALELNTEHANFYPAQALPGSPLYFEAKKNLGNAKSYESTLFSYEVNHYKQIIVLTSFRIQR